MVELQGADNIIFSQSSYSVHVAIK